MKANFIVSLGLWSMYMVIKVHEISSLYHIYVTFVLSKYHGMLCFSIKTIVLSVSRC